MQRKTKKHYRPRAVPKHERKRKKRASPKATTTALAKRTEVPTVSEAIEKVLIGGDLTPLSPEQRIDYMKAVCKSLGLNPLTGPFSYILFKETDNAPAKLVLYAKKDCAEQLRKIHGVSVIPGMTKRNLDDDFATVEVSVRDKWGKTDTATGMVYLWKKYEGKQYRLSGQRLADAILKAETKAKRRATLSVCGLGILDEHDLDSLRVVGGVTPEGRTFEYTEPPKHPDDASDIESLRARGLWCDEHNRMRSAKHLKACESSRKALEAKKKAPQAAQEPKSEPPKGKEPSQAAAPASASANANAPQLTLNWQVSEVSPRLTGDGELIEKLKGDIHASWENEGEAGSFWHVQGRDGETLRALQERYGYKLLEILPKQDSPSDATASRGTTPSPGGEKHGKRSGQSDVGTHRASDPAPAVETMEGIVEQANPGTGKNPKLNILFAVEPKKKFWLGCFDQALFPFVSKAAGMKCQFVVQKRVSGENTYTNIIGIKHIGNTYFDNDGKTPIIQQKDREAGGKTLFT